MDRMFPEMSPYSWFAIAFLAAAVAWWLYRSEIQQWRSTREWEKAEKAWRISPGAGVNAVDAIEKAESIEDARRVYRAFQATSSRRNVKEVYAAYTARLDAEGLDETNEAFDVGWDEAKEDEQP